jgi:Domain of unknown function (DUF4265)
VRDLAIDRVKVCFRLEDADGWPPVESEGVWAKPCGAGEYVLDNAPWFARGVAFGDRVRAEPDQNEVLWVAERVAWSGRYTVRVIPLGDGPAARQLRTIVDAFSPLGAECEGALPAFNLVALDIPPTAQLAEIKALLREGETEGRWAYEEGCIDSRWADL